MLIRNQQVSGSSPLVGSRKARRFERVAFTYAQRYRVPSAPL